MGGQRHAPATLPPGNTRYPLIYKASYNLLIDNHTVISVARKL
jgi:hypothetical protein